MEESEKNIKDYGIKLESAIEDFKKIIISSKDQTFWEKILPFLIPTIISSIIGISAFFAAFNLSEYKISVLMEERVGIVKNIEDLKQKVGQIHKNYEMSEFFINSNIADIHNDIKEIKISLQLNIRDHEIIKTELLDKINKLEVKISKLE